MGLREKPLGSANLPSLASPAHGDETRDAVPREFQPAFAFISFLADPCPLSVKLLESSFHTAVENVASG